MIRLLFLVFLFLSSVVYAGVSDRGGRGVIQSPLVPSGGGSGGIAWSDPVDSNIVPDTDGVYTIGEAGTAFDIGFLYSLSSPDQNHEVSLDGSIGLTTNGGINFSDSSSNGIIFNPASTSYLAITGQTVAVPFRFYEDSGANYVALKAASSIAADVIWTLPAADGSSGQVLSTDGSGVLSWSTPGGAPAGSTGAIQFNDSGAFAADSTKLFWDDVNDGLRVGTDTPLLGEALTVVKGGTGDWTVLSNIGTVTGGFYIAANGVASDVWSIGSLSNHRFQIFAADGAGAFITLQHDSQFIGINKDNPLAELDVNGSILISSASAIFNVPETITAGGTTGNRTIDKISGTVNFAAAATSLTVTNSTVTANSIVMAIARTNDSTCSVKNVVPAAGSFVINMDAACAAETSVGFFVLN